MKIALIISAMACLLTGCSKSAAEAAAEKSAEIGRIQNILIRYDEGVQPLSYELAVAELESISKTLQSNIVTSEEVGIASDDRPDWVRKLRLIAKLNEAGKRSELLREMAFRIGDTGKPGSSAEQSAADAHYAFIEETMKEFYEANQKTGVTFTVSLPAGTRFIGVGEYPHVTAIEYYRTAVKTGKHPYQDWTPGP